MATDEPLFHYRKVNDSPDETLTISPASKVILMSALWFACLFSMVRLSLCTLLLYFKAYCTFAMTFSVCHSSAA